jgi:hypothetical protein
MSLSRAMVVATSAGVLGRFNRPLATSVSASLHVGLTYLLRECEPDERVVTSC